MRMRPTYVLLATLLVAGCGLADAPTRIEARAQSSPRAVDGARISAADEEPGNWLTYGRTYDEQRYSPLSQINADNIDRLGLAWSYDTGRDRGHEATPIVVDGRMFLTAAWSEVHALDAATGTPLWTFDPDVDPAVGRWACCDVVNRGVAVWGSRVYVGVLDGRLIALDAETGAVDWKVQTTDPEKPYTITGAPRVVAGNVIIGNGGAEYGVRGYVTAYDAETGAQVWRFYTVPGNPSEPFEHPELETAAETWTGEWWEVGGGGTAWDSMAYDPELDLLYVGVGNGSPWTRLHRSPDGGDNLYLSSIIALRPATGRLVWHYQTTPGDNWDYTATQHIMLADLEIDGRERQVLMQAPKNGFFYVLDRATGELISAEKYVTVTWASHVDSATGRPVETADGTYDNQPQLILPSPAGGHNWHPMSFGRDTGLVYIPVLDVPFIFVLDQEFAPDSRRLNLGIDLARLPRLVSQVEQPPARGFLRAWNPVTQQEAWSVEHPGAFNGGVLSTAGNLVFQGTSDGRFSAYAADTGDRVWDRQVDIGIVAPPVTYSIEGRQFVAILAGWGGAVTFGFDAGVSAASSHQNPGRLLVFALDGGVPLPEVRETLDGFVVPSPGADLSAVENRGQNLYHEVCAVCHGFLAASSGVIVDLRLAPERSVEAFDAIVRGGALSEGGMPGFADLLSEEDAAAIHAYLMRRSTEDGIRSR